MRANLFEAIKQYLEKNNPDLWITVTFSKATSAKTADRIFRHALKYLNKGELKFYDKFIRGWAFYEQNSDSPGVHIHALVNGISPDLAPLIEKKFRKRFGMSKVKPMHSGVISYLAKKWNKDSLQDLGPLTVNRKRDRKNKTILTTTND